MPTRNSRIGTGLLVVAGAYLVAVSMMGLVAASRPPARLLDGLVDFQPALARYQWGFVGASLLAPCLITLLLLLSEAAQVPATSTRRSLALVLLAGYLPLATIAYTSQYTFLPGLIERDPPAAALWYLHDPASIPATIDLAGYTLLGMAAILLATLLAERGRRWLAGWLIAMGALSIAAFGAHAAGAGALAAVLSAASAGCTLPVVVLAILEGRRQRGQQALTAQRPEIPHSRDPRRPRR